MSVRRSNGLAIIHHYKGEYSKAEPLYQRALAIREKSLGPEHPTSRFSQQSREPLLR